jgi:O-antigen/teichoic acid export membrane protein
MVVSTVVTILLESGQRSAFFRFYFQNEIPSGRRKLSGTVLIYLLLSGVVILSPLLLFFDRIALPLLRNVTLFPLIKIALIGTFFDVGSTIPFTTFRAEQRAATFVGLSVFRFLINIALNIVAVVTLHWGAMGVIYANLFTSVLFFLICCGLQSRNIEWTVDLKLLKQGLSFGLPLVPASLAGWVLTMSDRFFLERYRDLREVGIYSVGYSIAGVLNMAMNCFNVAWLPYCFSISKEPDARKVYARVLLYAMFVFTFVGLGLSMFSREILALLTTRSYYEAAGVVPLIVLAYLFFEINYLLSVGLDLTGKTVYYPFIIGGCAVSNLFLNFMLIPPFGMMGAAVATVLSYALMPLAVYPVVDRLYPVNHDWKRLAKLAFVSVSFYLATLLLKTERVSVDVCVGTALLLAWGFTLYRVRFFTQNEIAAVRAIIPKAVSILK